MSNIPRVDFKDLDLKNAKKLGEGSFGKVYLVKPKAGVLQQFSEVAVKILKETSTEAEKDFKKEIEMFRKIGTHKHVVKMLGYCDAPSCIVMEYVITIVNGKKISGLLKYLSYLRNKARKDNMYYRTLQSFAVQIAQGMEHLEQKKIVHRDLAARNVLIDQDGNLKISDFGLSRIEVYYMMSPSGAFALRWASPEAIEKYKFTTKSDVWSFGIVLWEIATLGKVPYSELNDQEVQEFLRSGQHLKNPGGVTPEFFNIMLKCWAYKADDRPTFSNLVQELTQLQSYFLPNRLQKEEHSQEKSASLVHPGKLCNKCVGSIIGTRYKCTQCACYNLCQSCKGHTQHNGHTFQEIARPGKLNSAIIHPGISCNVCKRPVVGIRYKCSVCQDFNLCQSCKSTNKHNHPFSAIKYFSLSGGKIHPGVICSACKGSIMGIRYQCSACPNCNLCSACYNCGFHNEHKFFKIMDPEKSPNVSHPGINCSACQKPVSGTRYKCSVCLTYNLCQDCKRLGHHNHHKFCKVDYPSISKGYVHPGKTCNFCLGAIIAVRYRCQSCQNYNLCSSCKIRGHHQHHRFYTLLYPFRKPGMAHLFVTCDNCKKSIVGVRYKCSICKNYDLCENCKSAGHHKNHEFYSFV